MSDRSSLFTHKSQFIVYACPVGELNSQLEKYLARSRELYGENKAHKYMPHCTLTGFFTDEFNSISAYLQALDRAYDEAKKNNVTLNIKIERLIFSRDWHGLQLQADNLQGLVARFAEIENSPTRQADLRLKDWLHLSLAYGFKGDRATELQQLARKIINLESRVDWELRFYQRNLDWTWKCLKSWQI